MNKFPNAFFGSVSAPPPDWRSSEDTDPDDEEITTPKDVVAMLGFDPKEFEDGQEETGYRDGVFEGISGTDDMERGRPGAAESGGGVEDGDDEGGGTGNPGDGDWHPFLGLDEANFKESEHPRDADGKFAPYQHSLGLQGESGKKLKDDLKELDFSKAPKSKAGKYKYTNPLGATIVVEPPSGGNFKGKPGSLPWSTNWTLYPFENHPEPIKGKGNKALSAALADMKKYGMKKDQNTETDKEIEKLIAESKKPFKPKSELDDLTQKMQSHYAQPKKEEPKPEPKKETIADVPGSNKFVSAFAKHGFGGGGTISEDYVYTKGESKVKLHWDEKNGVFDKWLSYSPGHVMKEGTTPEQLESLLDGKVPDGVKNIKGVEPSYIDTWPKPPPAAATPASAPAKPQQQSEKWKEYKKAGYSDAEIAEMEKSQNWQSLQLELSADAPKATPQQKSAIHSYTGSSYSYMNDELRHGSQKISAGTTSAHLQEYLMKAEAPKDFTVYRKVGSEFAKFLKSIVFEGATWQDKGFTSCALNSNVWHGDVHMEIAVKKGTHGAFINNMSSNKGETEFLLAAGSIFRVAKITKQGNITHMKMEVVDQKLGYEI